LEASNACWKCHLCMFLIICLPKHFACLRSFYFLFAAYQIGQPLCYPATLCCIELSNTHPAKAFLITLFAYAPLLQILLQTQKQRMSEGLLEMIFLVKRKLQYVGGVYLTAMHSVLPNSSPVSF
jgi:hypothetical protein